jgi:hypothetical protein
MQFHTTGIVLASLTVVSAASAQTTQAVEWKVSEGGNGHWYARTSDSMNWTQAQSLANALGGHLATIVTASENSFAKALNDRRSCWLGGFQNRATATYFEPAGGWEWVTGEAWTFSDWFAYQPDNWFGVEDYLQFSIDGLGAIQWNDNALSESYPGLIEWSADCNDDGIVDYGQILRGELADLNGNGVPDVCEVSVSGVTPPSVPSQGGSTITIRGTNFQGTPSVKIGGIPATNVLTVSPISLTATSPVLSPGMTSVTVNGFTLPDAIYIRPECGSDLDQNGVVDNADISIILLDFGPCYQAPLATAAPEVPPLLDAQALPDAPRQR